MATERVVIQFRADGARVVQANITGVGRAAKKAAGETNTLKNALKTLIALETARRLVNLADTFTLLTNRVRVLTADQRNLVSTTNQLFEVANRTRTPIESNALLFQRLTLATKGLVSGQGEVLQIIETLNKALRISGTTTQEAAAGTIQLAQGFAFGALRGDELRSVMEQLPIVSRILEKELNVTRGELRALGKEGKITSEILVSAFKNARQEIDEQFGRVIPTIAEQFVVLRTNFIKLLGDFERATGVFKAFGDSVRFVADNLETFAKVAAVLALPAIVALTASIKALIAAGGLIAVAFTKVVVAIKAFLLALVSITGTLVTLLGIVIVFRDKIKAFFDAFTEGQTRLRIVEKEAAAANKRFREQQIVLKAAAEAQAQFLDKVEEAKEGLLEELVVLRLSTKEQEKRAEAEAFATELKKKGVDLTKKGTDEIRAEFEALRKRVKLAREESELLKKISTPMEKINRERATARRLLAQERGDREKLLKIARGEIDANRELLTQLENETKFLKLSTVEGEIAAEILEAENELKEKGIDLNSVLGRQQKEQLVTAILARREAEVRRQNLRDLNIDTSVQTEALIALSKQLKEAANNEFFRTQVLKGLDLEQAKILRGLNAISETEFDKVFERTVQPATELLEVLREEAKTLKLSNSEQEIRNQVLGITIALKRQEVDITDKKVQSLLKEIEAQAKLNQLERMRRDALREFGFDRREQEERERVLNELLRMQNTTFDQRVSIMRELNDVASDSTDFFAGLRQAFLDIDTTLKTFGATIGGFLVGAIDSAADALADFALSGFQDTQKLQQAFSDLFAQLAKDILKATIRLLIFQAIQAAITPAAGGLSGVTGLQAAGGPAQSGLDFVTFGGLGPVPAQAGAFLQAGQPSIVGERGPEPFVPTVSGRVLPNAVMGEQPAPQVTVVNVTDPKEVQQFLSTAEGEDVIMNVIQKRNRQVRGLLR